MKTNIEILEKVKIDYKKLKNENPILLLNILKAMDIARTEHTMDEDYNYSITTANKRIHFIAKENGTEKKYTIDDLKYCFEQSRLTHPMVGFKHDTFEDFINKTNNNN